MDISDQKSAARKAAFAARKSAFGTGLDAAANHNLLAALALFPKAQTIAGYMPIRTEVSPIATMTILHNQAKTICVPVIKGEAQPLEFHVWTPDMPMVDGPFGAQVPAKPEIVVPDLLITPLVAFDKDCYRLGYGGGFYDRSFEDIAATKPVTGIGFAYSAQNLPKIPREPTDHQLDAVATERGIITRA